MSALVEKVAHYSKMIEAACGTLAMFGTTLLDHQGMLPSNVVYYLNMAIGIFTVFRVWLVKNEQLIEDIVEEGEELYHDVHDLVYPDPVPAPAPAPTPAPVAHDLPTEAFQLPGRHER